MQFKIATFAMILAAAACGRAKAPTIQPRGHVEPPAFPVDSTQAFQLTEANTKLVFGVNALLWDDPTGEQVRDILDITKKRRVLAADALTTIKTELLPAVQSYNDLVTLGASAQGKIDAARRGRNLATLRSYIQGAVGGYVEAQLQAMVADQSLSAAEKAHADGIWAGYCESKILELAVSPQLARLYTQRPSPVALCESYYKGKKYFQDEALCGAAPAGKDYFGCIWNDGVLKSQLFPNRTTGPKCVPNAPLSKGDAIAGWIAADGSGPLRDILRSNLRAAASQTIFTGNAFNRAWIARTSAGQPPFPKLNNCAYAFARNAPTIPAGQDVDAAGVPFWAQDKPNRIILDLEIASATTKPAAYRLVPEGATPELSQARYARLSGVISPFARRKFNADIQPSYSDEELSAVVGQPELVADLGDRNAVESGPLLPKLKDFDTPELTDLKAKTSPKALNDALTKAVASRTNFDKVINAAVDKTVTDAIAVGVVKGASIFLNTYRMTVEKTGTELKVRLQFGTIADPVPPQVGCLNVDTNAPCDLAKEDLQALASSGSKPATVHFDRASNMIGFQFELGDHPEKLGFPLATREFNKASFNEIDPATLRGKSLLIDSYGNQLKDLRMITGNLYILDADGETRLYSGSLTGDTYDQQRDAILPPFIAPR